jgi:CheY-like chemotaxis protein
MAAQGRRSESEPERPPHILIVEDDPDVRALLYEVLAEDGYEVSAARDGADAIAQLRKRRPDAILLDLMMAGLDGWDFLSLYRQLPGPHAPVIVVTAAARGGIERAHDHGADAVVTKPFSVDRLLDLVAMQVRKRQNGERRAA